MGFGYFYSVSRVIFLVFLLCVCSCFGEEDELRSLLEFKKGIRDDPLGRVEGSWVSLSDPNGTICPAFYGVGCDTSSGYVTDIVLNHLGLSGELKFSTLNGLKWLKNLSLSGNTFSGRLVPTLGLMTTLQYLDLSENMFYGPIPAKINDLWGLHYLNLSLNQFTGGYPDGIRNLQQLKVLDLHHNGLWGDVGQLIPELRNVEHVDLSFNLFFGAIPGDVGNVSGLANTVQYMNLSGNKVSGGFFSAESIGLFRNLRVLDLGDNGLSGELPSFGSLPSLQVMRLRNNQFYGSIPQELVESVIPLQELDLSGNGFSGEKLWFCV